MPPPAVSRDMLSSNELDCPGGDIGTSTNEVVLKVERSSEKPLCISRCAACAKETLSGYISWLILYGRSLASFSVIM